MFLILLGSCLDPCTCGLGIFLGSIWDLFGIVPRVVWDSGRSLRRWGLGSFWDPYTGGLRSFEDPFQMFRGSGSESDPKTIRKRAENNPKTIRKRSPQVAGELGKDPKMIPKRSPELNQGIPKGSPSVNPPINNKVHTKGCKWRSTKCLVSIWGWDGVPKRVTDPKIQIARRLRTEQQHETPKLRTPEPFGEIQIHPTSFFAEREANVPQTTRGKDRSCGTHHGQRRKT